MKEGVHHNIFDRVSDQCEFGGNREYKFRLQYRKPPFECLENCLLSLCNGRIIFTFHGIAVGRLSLDIGLSKNLIECVRLFDSQKADPENQQKCDRTHYKAPWRHCKQIKGGKEIDHVSAAECEELDSHRGPLKFVHDCFRAFNCDNKHKKRQQGCCGTNKDV